MKVEICGNCKFWRKTPDGLGCGTWGYCDPIFEALCIDTEDSGINATAIETPEEFCCILYEEKE